MPFPVSLPQDGRPLGMWSGNEALAMGGAAAGVKFYAAYPMSPSTGVLHWMAANARDLGILVRQGEDELAVVNMTIGAGHAGCRAMCATSGGGFALMTEAIGMASMMEVPAVVINVMRAGPSTGVPTKTEQGDLWQKHLAPARATLSALSWRRWTRWTPSVPSPSCSIWWTSINVRVLC